jgi:hypothetical protein
LKLFQELGGGGDKGKWGGDEINYDIFDIL